MLNKLRVHLQCKYTTQNNWTGLESRHRKKQHLLPGTDPAGITAVTARTKSKAYACTKYVLWAQNLYCEGNYQTEEIRSGLTNLIFTSATPGSCQDIKRVQGAAHGHGAAVLPQHLLLHLGTSVLQFSIILNTKPCVKVYRRKHCLLQDYLRTIL